MKATRIEIIQDQDAESPREWENLGTMICAHGRYKLGDEQVEQDRFNSWKEVRDMLIKERDAVIVLPLNLYDHSGLSLSTGWGQGWDNGVVGFIYATNDDIKKEYGKVNKVSLERAKSVLEAEVQEYSYYLEGDVWTVIGYDKDDEVVESLSGLYGQDAVDDYVNELKGIIKVEA